MLRIHVLPALGKMALDENLAEHIIALVARMRSDGYAAGTSNRVVMILRYMYNLAAKWKVPGVTRNPTGGIELGQEAQRNRFLSREEAQRLVDAITVDGNRTAADAILLLMLTGAAQRNHPGEMGTRAMHRAQASGAAVEVGQAAMDCAQYVGRCSIRSRNLPAAITFSRRR